jgi:hypothetical protein
MPGDIRRAFRLRQPAIRARCSVPDAKAQPMSDADQLVAAILSATMNLREPTQAGLIEHYEYFMREIPARRKAAQQRLDENAHDAWTKRS